jgi:hypothetical protein
MRRQITSTSCVPRFSAAAASRWLPSGCWVDTVQRELAVLARHGVGDVAFQVELLLLAAARAARPAAAARRRWPRPRRRAQASWSGCTKLPASSACSMVMMAGSSRTFTCALGRGLARIEHLARHHHGHRLAEVRTVPSARKGSSWTMGPQLFSPGNVARGEHRHHAVLASSAARSMPSPTSSPWPPATGDQRGIQRAAQLGDVVGVDGLAGDVQPGRFVRQFLALFAGRARRRPVRPVWRGAFMAQARSGQRRRFGLHEAQHQVARHQRAVGPGGAQAVAVGEAARNGVVQRGGGSPRARPSSTPRSSRARAGNGVRPL